MFVKQQELYGFTEKDIKKCRMPLYPFFRAKIYAELAVTYGIWLGPTALFLLLISGIANARSLPEIIIYAVFLGLSIWLATYLYRSCDDFAEILAQRNYVKKYTMKGSALTKGDFLTLEAKDEYVYERIVNMVTCGHCYEVCFRLLKALKTGRIFITAMPLENKNVIKSGGKKYTAHMLYEKDGWVFDAFTCRQYEKEDFIKIFDLPWGYGNWCYADIADISYEEFREKYGEAVHRQCEANDCYAEFKHED